MENHLGRRVTLAFSVLIVLSALGPAPRADAAPGDGRGAQGDSDEYATRAPKDAEPSCSSGRSVARDSNGDGRSGERADLGRQRAAAPIRPAASAGGDSESGCPGERRGAGSRRAAGDDHRVEAESHASDADGNTNERRRSADTAEPNDDSSMNTPRGAGDGSAERRTTGGYEGRRSGSPAAGGSGAPGARTQTSPSSNRGSDSRPAPSPASSGTNSGAPVGSGSGDTGAAASSPSGSNGEGEPSGASASPGGSDGRSSSGTHTGGRRSGAGAGNSGAARREGGPATNGTPGASGGGNGNPGGVRFSPAAPPRTRSGSDSGDGVPRITWAAFRAPGIALVAGPGTQPPAVVLPSTTAAVLGATDTTTEPLATAAPAGPLARTGGDATASTALALTLILLGGVLRRTSRPRSAGRQRALAR